MTLGPGDLAPDFTLPGSTPDGLRDYTLSAERGHPLVLAFYPGDNTPVCTKQLGSYQHGFESFEDLGARLWGISSQGIDSHQAFAKKHGLAFPLLADTDRVVQKAYGAHGLLGTKRAVFVIDATGRIAWSHVSRTGLTYQNVDAIADALRAAGV